MAFPPPDSGVQGRCARTEAEAADLREASQLLLMAAAATMLEPVAPLAVLAYVYGWLTATTAANVVWDLVACIGHVHGVLASYYFLFYAVLLGTMLVSAFVILG